MQQKKAPREIDSNDLLMIVIYSVASLMIGDFIKYFFASCGKFVLYGVTFLCFVGMDFAVRHYTKRRADS